MPITDIAAGQSASVAWKVTEDLCTTRGRFQIFSTPNLVLLLESAGIQALAEHLDKGQACVGTRVDISHSGATLLGQTVTATATVTEVDRRRVAFAVEVHDDDAPVATGTHERFVVDVANFEARLADKAARLA